MENSEPVKWMSFALYLLNSAYRNEDCYTARVKNDNRLILVRSHKEMLMLEIYDVGIFLRCYANSSEGIEMLDEWKPTEPPQSWKVEMVILKMGIYDG